MLDVIDDPYTAGVVAALEGDLPVARFFERDAAVEFLRSHPSKGLTDEDWEWYQGVVVFLARYDRSRPCTHESS